MAASTFAGQRLEVDDLTKRRFFYRAAFDIYGGTAGLLTYGPPGCALKTNLCAQWRKHFIIEDNMMEIEDPTVTPYHVLDASGHVERFNDFMVKRQPAVFSYPTTTCIQGYKGAA
jgi:glycyl-tRNA synthetase